MTGISKLWLAFASGIVLAVIVGSAWNSTRDVRPAHPVAVPSAQHDKPGSNPAPSRVTVEKRDGRANGPSFQTATVARTEVAEEVSAPVTVVPDESRISHIHTRVTGWIERLHVANTGEMVRAGQPIADIFSQELFASQAEYLAARVMKGPPSAVVESGRARLQFFGMSDNDIAAIEKTGKPRRVVTLYAPRTGILAHRGISAGTAVDPSTEIAIVLDLSRVWVVAEVPEFASASISKGMHATLAFGSSEAAPIPATVEFIDPILTESTRTLRVRFSLPNAGGQLRPGMYGTALFQKPVRRALTVPRDAVVDTGASQYVYVLNDQGGYEPRPVRIGARLRDVVEIVSGLNEGEKIVTSGVFLLDSESRLRASGGQGTSHAGHGQAAPSENKPHASGEGGHD